jgi:uncharacterized protein
MSPKPRIVLPGGSGFLGRTLAKHFASRGAEVIVLSRRGGTTHFARVVEWDGTTVGPWAGVLEGAAAVVNLAGRSVNCRYNAENRREIMDSRVLSTRALGRAIQHCHAPPAVWLNSSTATIYKHTYGLPHGEAGEIAATPEARDAFSIEVARAWEAEFERAETPMTRKVTLRTAIVFGNEPGGVYEILRRLARAGLGGRNGDGRQYVSWIHAEDFCRAVEWLIGNGKARGIYNLAAPNPLPNGEAMAAIRKAVGMKLGLPATRWMLDLGARVIGTD